MSDFWPNPWTNSHGKMQILWPFYIDVFYSLEGLLLYLEHYQRGFLGLFCLKRKVEQMSNFWLEAWTIPFGKMQILRPICIDVFIV